jgi:hypothetical protein
VIIPETSQFIASRDKDYVPEVHPSIRTAIFSSQSEKGSCSLELTSAQVSNQRAYKFNSSEELELVEKTARED